MTRVKDDPTLRARIEKLPQWARDHIEDLKRQRDTAIKALDDFEDHQTPQPFFVEELVCETPGAPRTRRKYIEGRTIQMEHRGMGVRLTIYENTLHFQYGGVGGHYSDSIHCYPASHQVFQLEFPEKDKKP